MKDKNNEKVNKKNNWPATLYVEGQDQFRGWFNSSLITSVILTGEAPYQQVLSHGFVVDEKGHKMSKSLGNVIKPEEIMEKFGVDILRLWVISSDFTKEIKISIPILKNLQESYQKIRNTCRFLLGNLANFPLEIKSEKDCEKNLSIIDYYILHQLEKLIAENQKKYQEYNFNPIFTSLLNFCINDLSSFYFEISKDSLYCDSLENPRRKQIITTLYYLLWGLLKVITPILPFLAEEVYQNTPFYSRFINQPSIFLVNYFPTFSFPPNSKKEIELITNFFLPLRKNIFSCLEKSRREGIITTNSQASLLVYLPREKNIVYHGLNLNLADLLLVAEVKLSEKKEKNDFDLVKIEKTNRKRCMRCWNYRELAKEVCRRCEKISPSWIS